MINNRIKEKEETGIDKKIFLEAIKKMPDKFVDDETDWCVYSDSMIISNPKYPPMVYNTLFMEWRNLRMEGD